MEKRMVKRLAAAMLAATVAIGTPMAASATWRTEGKGWNWTVDGKNATGWQMIENTWYYFNSEGTMQTGWVPYGNSWYFLQPSGAMATGWVQDNGKWYYTKADGAMATGWVQAGDTWYCMSSTGEMRTGWVASGDDWYYLAPTGAMVTDAVIKVDDAVYAIAADGSMQTGEVEIAGETYTFGDDGAATGETIPEPDRSFSTTAAPGGAPVETTPTTPPSDNGGSTTTPTTPTKPSRPSYGGGGGGSYTPVETQNVTMRPRGEAGNSNPDFDYPGAYGDAGVSFDPSTNTITYVPTGTVAPELHAGGEGQVNNPYAIGLQFEEPAGAVKVKYNVDGQVTGTQVLTEVVNGDHLFRQHFIQYFGFASKEGYPLPDKSWNVSLTWYDENDAVIADRTVTINRVSKPVTFGTPPESADLYGKHTSDLGTFTVSQPDENNVVHVSGQAKQIVTPWAGFSSIGDEQIGYYVPVHILPKLFKTGDTVNQPTVTAGRAVKDDVYHVVRVGGVNAGDFNGKTVTVTVDYGSDSMLCWSKTYTIDFSGVTPIQTNSRSFAPAAPASEGTDENTPVDSDTPEESDDTTSDTTNSTNTTPEDDTDTTPNGGEPTTEPTNDAE